jgi:hypothetical protein
MPAPGRVGWSSTWNGRGTWSCTRRRRASKGHRGVLPAGLRRPRSRTTASRSPRRSERGLSATTGRGPRAPATTSDHPVSPSRAPGYRACGANPAKKSYAIGEAPGDPPVVCGLAFPGRDTPFAIAWRISAKIVPLLQCAEINPYSDALARRPAAGAGVGVSIPHTVPHAKNRQNTGFAMGSRESPAIDSVKIPDRPCRRDAPHAAARSAASSRPRYVAIAPGPDRSVPVRPSRASASGL